MSRSDPAGPGPADPGTSHGRYRARHVDAAPDAYPGFAWPPVAPAATAGGPAAAGDAAGGDLDAADTQQIPRYAEPAAPPRRPPRVPPPAAPTAVPPPAGPTAVPPPAGPTAVPPAGSVPGPPDPAAPAAAVPGGPARGRAGRNLPAAVAVGVGLGAVVLLTLFLWKPAFLAVIVAAVCVGVWEMTRAIRASGAAPPLAPLLGGGVVMVTVAWLYGPDALSLGLLVTVLAVLVWRLADGPADYQRDVTAATLIAVYVPFLGGFAALLTVPDDGHWRILIMLAVVVLSDTGGYLAGVFLGRHKMAPRISPKKTWEGLAGSLGAAALGGAVLTTVLLGVAWWWGLLFGLVVASAAVFGDLVESLLKRDLGVKDMSGLLPGHGGLMDRLDSILLAAPTAYLLLTVLAPP